jgi:hypothetical protein
MSLRRFNHDWFQLGQVLVEIRRHPVQDTQQVYDNCRRILDHEPATRFASGEMYSSEPIGAAVLTMK